MSVMHDFKLIVINTVFAIAVSVVLGFSRTRRDLCYSLLRFDIPVYVILGSLWACGENVMPFRASFAVFLLCCFHLRYWIRLLKVHGVDVFGWGQLSRSSPKHRQGHSTYPVKQVFKQDPPDK